MKLLLFFLLLLISINNSIANDLSVIDLSKSTSTITRSHWSCFKESGFSKAIIQAWSDKDGYNFNLKDLYNDSSNNGLKLDIYSSLCNKCKDKLQSSASTMKLLIYNLNIENIKFDKLWIDIEDGNNWDGHFKNNAEYILEAIDVAEQLGVEIGIYTTRHDWKTIVGPLSSLHNYPLWLKLSNSIDNVSFGGWKTASLTQDIKDIKMCGVNVNLNTNHTINPNSTTPNNTVTSDVYHSPNHTISPNSTATPNNTVSHDTYYAPNHTINSNSTVPNNTVTSDIYHTPNHTINPNSTATPNNTVSYDAYNTPNHTINSTTSGNGTTSGNSTLTSNNTPTYTKIDTTVASTSNRGNSKSSNNSIHIKTNKNRYKILNNNY